MKPLAILLLAFPLLAPSEPPAANAEPALTPSPADLEAELVEERHPNGVLAKRYRKLDGKAEGVWLEWFDTGGLRFFSEWKDGKGDGVWLYFHPNGQLRYRAWVIADIWDGPTEGWHPNGAMEFSGRMAGGYKLAPFGYWDESGNWAAPLPDPAIDERQRIIAEGWPDWFNFWDFTLTPDNETIFAATGDDQGGNRRILMREWKDGAWSAAELAPFAQPRATEGTPVITPDGAHVYFSSDRHAADEPDNPHRDLYRASRASGWTEVERVTRTPLFGEITLSLACDGRGALWSDRRGDGEERMALDEVRVAEGRLEYAGSLNDLHTGDVSNENFTLMLPDGEAMVFANYNIAGETDEDLYLVRREGAGWGAPQRLGPRVNSDATETSPHLTGDGRLLAFRSSAGPKSGFYTVPWSMVARDVDASRARDCRVPVIAPVNE